MTALQPHPGASRVARERRRIVVSGVVQGVGFRPFVWTLAQRHGVAGTVCNTSGAVVIEAEGPPAALDALASALDHEAPPLARIAGIEQVSLPLRGDDGFSIQESRPVAGAYQPIAPDAATCDACLEEMWDPGDRRHLHPFINCTGCGPRFTIIEDIPYDRARTTMRAFAMCDACASEYADPSSRRFHAQPNACPACGPRVWLSDPRGTVLTGAAVPAAAAALRCGEIVAVKGLGGFQLAVAATDDVAVARLRARKHRPDKPFALMVASLEAAHALAHVDAAEAAALGSPARPIVLLRARAHAGIAAAVAPGLDEVGVMLPCTPLHHLLLCEAGIPLVVTSGNVSDEPIAKDNAEALQRLGGIADVFLLHDRDIWARYDDSVVRVVAGSTHVVRRARGLCPLPLEVPTATSTHVLAMGAHLKNTFTILRDGRAFVGPHIGDLDHPEALRHHDESLTTYLRLFRAAPHTVVADLHPGYMSTHLAQAWWERGAAADRVQHHHAHIASVMAEHGLRGPVIGVAFDGTGHGEDGTVWGGEFLLCDEASSTRLGHLTPVTQPGGDRCAREGWRMVAAYLAALGAGTDDPPPWMRGEGAPGEREWRLVGRLAAAGGANAPITTSAGRLFDAVASLLGVAHVSSFEASAAMRLEALARTATGRVITVPVVRGGTGAVVLDTSTLVAELVAARAAGADPASLAATFHESLARGVVAVCAQLAEQTGASRVALSGGVFQNALLLNRTTHLLGAARLTVFSNRAVPANDGGVSLGQAYVAAWRLDAGRQAVAR
ncbi:MAG: carbamoyltransferase HypF [Candidatus Dormibacteria bacterium]